MALAALVLLQATIRACWARIDPHCLRIVDRVWYMHRIHVDRLEHDEYSAAIHTEILHVFDLLRASCPKIFEQLQAAVDEGNEEERTKLSGLHHLMHQQCAT